MGNWIVGIISSIVTTSVTYFFNRRGQIAFEERRLKEKYYFDYINAISYNVISEGDSKSKDMMSDSYNKILLVGSSDVVRSLLEFTDYLLENKQKKNKLELHDKLFTNLVVAMRKDIYRKGFNKKYPKEVYLMGNSSKSIFNRNN